MKVSKITIEGKVKGKGRPRFSKGNVYTPEDTVEYENWIKFSYKNQSNVYFTEAIKATIVIYIEIPKRCTKKRLCDIMEKRELPCKTPDIDNILKCVFDALNKVAYDDDKQIIEVHALKQYTSSKERIELTLEEIKVEVTNFGFEQFESTTEERSN